MIDNDDDDDATKRTGILDVCCDLSAPAKSWCKKYCEVSHGQLLCYREQSDSTAELKLPLRETPVYVGDKAFTLVHRGKQFGFRVCKHSATVAYYYISLSVVFVGELFFYTAFV